MKNFIPTNVARIVFALTMLFFASGHFMNAKPMTEMMLAGWPMGEALTYISGACLALAGIAFIINKQVKLAGYLLALLLVIIVIGVHVPGLTSPDKMMQMSSMSNAVKDAAIAMGALAFANVAE